MSSAHHIKRLRRLFLLCTVLFITDDCCSMPMHTLITDVIESQGGNTLVVKILNRIGVCASADTLSRFIQHKASTCKVGAKKYLNCNTFTVVSADNIDFMRTFFCSHQTSSRHGTTVQAIQPLPSLSLPEGLLNEATVLGNVQTSVLTESLTDVLTDSHAGGSPLDPPGGIRLTDSLGGCSPRIHPEASASQTSLVVALPWTHPVYHKREKTGPHHYCHHRILPGHHCQKYRNVIILALKDNRKLENYHLHQSSSKRAIAVL